MMNTLIKNRNPDLNLLFPLSLIEYNNFRTVIRCGSTWHENEARTVNGIIVRQHSGFELIIERLIYDPIPMETLSTAGDLGPSFYLGNPDFKISLGLGKPTYKEFYLLLRDPFSDTPLFSPRPTSYNGVLVKDACNDNYKLCIHEVPYYDWFEGFYDLAYLISKADVEQREYFLYNLPNAYYSIVTGPSRPSVVEGLEVTADRFSWSYSPGVLDNNRRRITLTQVTYNLEFIEGPSCNEESSCFDVESNKGFLTLFMTIVVTTSYPLECREVFTPVAAVEFFPRTKRSAYYNWAKTQVEFESLNSPLLKNVKTGMDGYPKPYFFPNLLNPTQSYYQPRLKAMYNSFIRFYSGVEFPPEDPGIDHVYNTGIRCYASNQSPLPISERKVYALYGDGGSPSGYSWLPSETMARLHFAIYKKSPIKRVLTCTIPDYIVYNWVGYEGSCMCVNELAMFPTGIIVAYYYATGEDYHGNPIHTPVFSDDSGNTYQPFSWVRSDKYFYLDLLYEEFIIGISYNFELELHPLTTKFEYRTSYGYSHQISMRYNIMYYYGPISLMVDSYIDASFWIYSQNKPPLGPLPKVEWVQCFRTYLDYVRDATPPYQDLKEFLTFNLTYVIVYTMNGVNLRKEVDGSSYSTFNVENVLNPYGVVEPFITWDYTTDIIGGLVTTSLNSVNIVLTYQARNLTIDDYQVDLSYALGLVTIEESYLRFTGDAGEWYLNIALP